MKHQTLQCYVLAIFGLLLSGCASIPGYMMTQIKTDVGETFLIHKQNTSLKWSVGSHVMLAEVSSNRLALSYLPGGELGGPAVYPWPSYTDDKGKTWSFGDPFNADTNGLMSRRPFFVGGGEKFPKYYHGIFFSGARFSNGERVFYDGYTTRPLYSVLSIRSKDDGKTWEKPQAITLSYPKELTFEPDYLALGPMAAVTSQDVMYVVAGALDRKKVKLTTILYKSEDRGKTLTPVGVVAELRHARYGKMAHGPGEPAIIALSDTELICVMRTGTRQGTAGISLNVEAEDMLLARSLDGGLTWKRSRMHVQGVMPKVIKMSNGMLVLATGRPGNRIYFSVDGGRRWGGEIQLSPYSQMSSGYMDIKEVEPGKLLVVYDMINSPLPPNLQADGGDGAVKKVGDFLYTVLIGPLEKSGKKYNQILGCYIDVAPR